MPYTIHRHATADGFLQRAEAWLAQNEAEHNLILGLADRLRQSAEGYEPPIYMATVEEGGQVVGCVFRTPPHKLLLTRLPPEAVPVVMRAVAEVYESLPAILGPEVEAVSAGVEWDRLRGTWSQPEMRQGVYELRTLTWPPVLPDGHLRTAREADLPLISQWVEDFAVDTGIPLNMSPELVAQRIVQGAFVVWDDGEPRTMAAVVAKTPNGRRVGAVYTPPRWRGRGYASAVVAGLTEKVLQEGCRFCFLYTNMANPTSNKIYQRLGYNLVAEVVDVGIRDNGPPRH